MPPRPRLPPPSSARLAALAVGPRPAAGLGRSRARAPSISLANPTAVDPDGPSPSQRVPRRPAIRWGRAGDRVGSLPPRWTHRASPEHNVAPGGFVRATRRCGPTRLHAMIAARGLLALGVIAGSPRRSRRRRDGPRRRRRPWSRGVAEVRPATADPTPALRTADPSATGPSRARCPSIRSTGSGESPPHRGPAPCVAAPRRVASPASGAPAKRGARVPRSRSRF